MATILLKLNKSKKIALFILCLTFLRLASTIGANVLLELPQKSDGLTQLERGEVVQAFVIASI